MSRQIIGTLKHALTQTADMFGPIGHVALVHVPLVGLGRLKGGLTELTLLHYDSR